MRTRPHHDRLHVAGQNAPRVLHRLVTRELELVAAQDQWRAAELRHPDLERDARARRGLLEHQRDALARERLGTLAAGPPSLERKRAVEQRAQFIAGELLAGQEVARHRSRAWYALTTPPESATVDGNRLRHGLDPPRLILPPWSSASSPGTCSTVATSRPIRRSSPGAPGCGGRPSATPPT